MRAHWQRIHDSLVRTLNRHTTHQTFRVMRQQSLALQPWSGPGELIGHLHNRGGDPDTKNAMLVALTGAAQRGGGGGACATTIVLLALWPGLDAIYRRRLQHFRHSADDLASEISARASEQVGRLHLGKVTQIAATVVRNVERDLLRDLRKAWARDASTDPIERANLVVTVHDAHDVALVQHDLHGILGEDSGLVVDIALYEFSQREAAERRGLTPDAGRKRYQRALRRLRNVPQFFDGAMSQPGAADGVSPQEAPGLSRRGHG